MNIQVLWESHEERFSRIFLSFLLLLRTRSFCILSGINANGICCFGPGFLVCCAFALSITASGLCNFVRLDDGNFLRLPEENYRGVESVGFWCYEQVGTGIRYSLGSLPTGSELEKARAFGLTANIIGFVVWIIYLFMGCIPIPPMGIIAVGCLCELVCLFEGLKFWIFKSPFFCDNENGGCGLDAGAKCSISAAVLWFLVGCMACAHAKERMMAAEKGDANQQPDQDDDDNKQDE